MKGSTLIETLIYTALLGVLMVGVLSSVYMLINSEHRTEQSAQDDNSLILETYHE